jgi:WD40 repeat protein
MGGPMKGISSWNDTIAVGFGYGDIVTLDAITGSQTATFSGHTDEVKSVTFSSDGKSLVSGSSDKTVKLWDVQTGGVVATFIGHTSSVFSVSISVDHTTIATGSYDKTLRLWDIQTGECNHIIKQPGLVHSVGFSPTNPQCFLSVCMGKVSQWDTGGHQVGPTFSGNYAVFSPDGTQIVSHYETTAVVRNSSSGEIVAKFHIAPDEYDRYLCFSPNGRLVVATTGSTVYVWDITGSSLALLKPSLDILALSTPSHFPLLPLLSQHPMTNQSNSGRFICHQWIQLRLIQSLHLSPQP